MKEILTIEEWNEVLEKSKDEPILLLKHSTTFAQSAQVLLANLKNLKQQCLNIG